MAEIVALEQQRDPGAVEVLEEALELARSGELVSVVVVGLLPGNDLYRAGAFKDRVHFLGVLEYAKGGLF